MAEKDKTAGIGNSLTRANTPDDGGVAVEDNPLNELAAAGEGAFRDAASVAAELAGHAYVDPDRAPAEGEVTRIFAADGSVSVDSSPHPLEALNSRWSVWSREFNSYCCS